MDAVKNGSELAASVRYRRSAEKKLTIGRRTRAAKGGPGFLPQGDDGIVSIKLATGIILNDTVGCALR
jgi:hypothetical protein